MGIMNTKAAKYKWNIYSSSQDDIRYKNNINLKKQFDNYTKKKGSFQVSIQVWLICK